MADAEALGIDPALLIPEPTEEEGLWVQHVPAFNAFLSVARQWRTAATPVGVMWLGLDYTAVRAGLDLAGQEITPDLWAEVQEIETGAVRALNGVSP